LLREPSWREELDGRRGRAAEAEERRRLPWRLRLLPSLLLVASCCSMGTLGMLLPLQDTNGGQDGTWLMGEGG